MLISGSPLIEQWGALICMSFPIGVNIGEMTRAGHYQTVVNCGFTEGQLSCPLPT